MNYTLCKVHIQKELQRDHVKTVLEGEIIEQHRILPPEASYNACA